MPQTLVPGGNAPLNVSDITIHINSGADIETLALRLAADGSPRDSGDFINSSQTQSADGSIRRGGNLHHSSYHIDLARQPAAVERILIACVASQPIARLGALQLGVEAERQTLITCPYDLTGRSETALVLGECYRRNGVWKFRNIAQGYNGGRQPLLARYGADNLRPAPAAAPRPSGGGVSLQKITLDQHTPGVSLTKQADYGEIRINLNWNQGKPGLLGKLGGLLGRNQGVDLDLGAFIRLQNGNRDCIQALGNRFALHPSARRRPHRRGGRRRMARRERLALGGHRRNPCLYFYLRRRGELGRDRRHRYPARPGAANRNPPHRRRPAPPHVRHRPPHQRARQHPRGAHQPLFRRPPQYG